MKVALIFGVTGQDGSYLSDYLLENNYIVKGVKRRSSSINTMRLQHIIDKYSEDRFELLHGDITDTSSVYNLISKTKPDVVFNLAAQSHVGVSFNEPEYTSQVDAVGTLRLLEAIKNCCPDIPFYHASTSELYGGLYNKPLNEDTPFNPRSPYAAAKLYAFYMVKQYREAYNLKAYNGIFFNHESPRRGENFVSRKITLEINNIFLGKSKFIQLGNLDAIRDWGHAKDYVEAMNVMLNKCPPGDYVVATGQCFSVRDFCHKAFEVSGHKIAFYGTGLEEYAKVVGYCDTDIKLKPRPLDEIVIRVSKKYFRPLEVPHLLGDSSKFRKLTGWKPKIEFDQLVYEMVKNDFHA
jgi:GDPmannose 4,6-dehydratase